VLKSKNIITTAISVERIDICPLNDTCPMRKEKLEKNHRKQAPENVYSLLLKMSI
jgi:hypothetical protein